MTASTLADRGKDVVLLEEGPNLPINSCPPFSIDEMRQKYRAGGLNPALGEPVVPFVEGRCVGGGSEINSGMYHRTPPEVLAHWRDKFRVKHLEVDDLLPHFEACEAELSVQVNPGRPPGAARKLRAGADLIGWKSKEVPRWIKYDDATTKEHKYPGRRQSMTQTLIPRALASGCRLMAGVRANRLARRKNKWQVTAQRNATPLVVFADAVFLCCGAIQTPALLRRSGIRQNIGNSLALHPMVKVVAIFPEAINDDPADVPSQQVTEFAPQVCMGCSISSLPYLALAMTDHAEAKLDITRCWRSALIFYVMTMGPSTGTVRNVPFSTDPLVRYRLGDTDLGILAKSLRDLCQLLFAAGARDLYPSISGFPVMTSCDDLRRIPDQLPRELTNLTAIHLFSSCAMGEARELCAVDSFGKVHGQENLFVNDASLLCTAPGVNPQGSIMAIARRNALHFAKDL